MSVASNRYLKIDGSSAETERSTCGYRQRLVKQAHGAPASVTRLKIDDAKAHNHLHTHEYYYVLSGEGTLVIDDDRVPVQAGDCVWIQPPAVHRAEGELEALIIAVPAYDPVDTFLV
jgi:mannose-6-phosphate isomerase-like protein (cupin superfamily)